MRAETTDKVIVSILMATYRESVDVLKKAVDSILKQTYKDFEFIIIVDDPTNSENIYVLKKYEAEDSRIRIIINEKNLGLTKSLNKGIHESRGRYIARMDADDISFPDRVDVELKLLLDNDYDIIASNIAHIDEKGNLLDDRTGCRYREDRVSKALPYTDCMPHPTWLCKKEMYEELSGYRDVIACEDYDFLLRVLALGSVKKIGYTNRVTLYHRGGASSVSANNSLRQVIATEYMSRNRNRIADIDEEYINRKVSSKLSNQRVHKYDEAYKIFLKGRFEKNSFFRFVRIVQSIFKSRYMLLTYKQIFLRKIILGG